LIFEVSWLAASACGMGAETALPVQEAVVFAVPHGSKPGFLRLRTRPSLNRQTNTMNPSDLIDRFRERTAAEKLVLASLALVEVAPGKSRLVEYLRQGGFRSQADIAYTNASIDNVLSGLIQVGLVDNTAEGGFRCASAVPVSALRGAMADGTFNKICDAVDTVDRANSSVGRSHPTNAHNARVMLRMALLRQREMVDVHRCLSSLFETIHTYDQHPYIELFGRPFDLEFLALLLPEAQQEVLSLLLRDALHRLAPVAPLAQAVQRLLGASKTPAALFMPVYAELCLLCGRFDQAIELAGSHEDASAQLIRSAAWLLKGDLAGAITGFEAALKTLRAASGKRQVVFGGFCGYLHVLALLRSGDERLKKKAQVFMALGLRTSGANLLVFNRLQFFNDVNRGTRRLIDRDNQSAPKEPVGQLLAGLIDDWIGAPRSLLQDTALAELGLKAEAAGFHFIAV